MIRNRPDAHFDTAILQLPQIRKDLINFLIRPGVYYGARSPIVVGIVQDEFILLDIELTKAIRRCWRNVLEVRSDRVLGNLGFRVTGVAEGAGGIDVRALRFRGGCGKLDLVLWRVEDGVFIVC